MEKISYENGSEEAWVCICGNRSASEGFFPCDLRGNEVDPVAGSNWSGVYACARCGRMIHQLTLEVVGVGKPAY